MSVLHLLRVGEVEPHLLDGLRSELVAEFRVPCEVLGAVLDPSFALNPERRQHHSTEMLAKMGAHLTPDTWRLLGVTSVDLYIPILTFVFGEAQVGGPCAVASMHRLRQEFYGLPPNISLLRDRLVKEAVHEVGHTLGLTHCEDYRCAMASSHGVEWIDLKEPTLCSACRPRCPRPGAGNFRFP